MKRRLRLFQGFLLGAILVGLSSPAWAARFSESRIYIEYNSSANDLGFHVSLDGEDWRTLAIVNPAGTAIFQVEGKGPYRDLGMTELFFEGAEPSLDEFPLANLLALFPEGNYTFSGQTVSGTRLSGRGALTHAIPAGPAVSVEVNGEDIVILWQPVTSPPPGFPDRRIQIVAYQVIAEKENPHREFNATLPATATSVTVPPEFLEPRTRFACEVLAIEAGGNQTITECSFETP